MSRVHHRIQNTLIHIVLIAIFCITVANSGANNLHVNDGTSIADIIGGDVFFEIIDPEELEYTYRIRPAKDFGAPFNSSFSAQGVRLVPVQPIYGCTKPTNTEELEGSVALVERGTCSFKSKTLIVERAGAIAVIITDESVESEEYFIEMIDDESLQETYIPAGFLLGKNGYMIRRTLKKLHRDFALINIPVNLTFTPVHKINQPPWLEW
ncbi:uncharacterized protein CBL_12544 [Carabus blaptoides fortunei]